jgi:anti-sigma factor ChrR (cupin superfamily)
MSDTPTTLIFPALLARALLPPDHADALVWEFFREGIEIHPLHGTGTGGMASALLRYQPGATVPRHRHPGWEHIIILQGGQVDDNGAHGPGSVLASQPGSSHAIAAPEGCVVLAMWEKPVEFI